MGPAEQGADLIAANGSFPARADGQARPADIAVVRGQPAADELAALITVLTWRQRQARAGSARPRPASQWAARTRLVRAPVTAGPGAWRASAMPW